MKLPVTFLPFDPAHDHKGSNGVDDDSSQDTDEDDDDGFEQDDLHDPITNGTDNHESKQSRHIGGGVLLVSISLSEWPVYHLRWYVGFRKWMRPGGDACCSNEEDCESSSSGSIDGGRADSSSTRLLHIQAGEW